MAASDHAREAQLRTRAAAGDRNAGGALGGLLRGRGEIEEALAVFARAYEGDIGSAATRRLAELLIEQGKLEEAADVWCVSDTMDRNPEGPYQTYLSTLDFEDWQDIDSFEPEDDIYCHAERVVDVLIERCDEASIAELWARADDHGGSAKRWLAGVLAELDDVTAIAKLRARADAGNRTAARWLAERVATGTSPV